MFVILVTVAQTLLMLPYGGNVNRITPVTDADNYVWPGEELTTLTMDTAPHHMNNMVLVVTKLMLLQLATAISTVNGSFRHGGLLCPGGQKYRDRRQTAQDKFKCFRLILDKSFL